MFENLLGNAPEKRTQLFFHDDGSFEFRKLRIESACLVETKDEDFVKAWSHFYSAEMPFDGYKNIHADMVTLGFDRDYILDPFNKVPISETPTGGKPARTEAAIKKWTAQVGESQRYKVMNKPGNMLLLDKVTMFLGIGLILMLLIFGITKAWG